MVKRVALLLSVLFLLPLVIASPGLDIIGNNMSGVIELNPPSQTDGPGGNETYFNTKYWRLDGTNAPPTANWNMSGYGFLGINKLIDYSTKFDDVSYLNAVNLYSLGIGNSFLTSPTGGMAIYGYVLGASNIIAKSSGSAEALRPTFIVGSGNTINDSSLSAGIGIIGYTNTQNRTSNMMGAQSIFLGSFDTGLSINQTASKFVRYRPTYEGVQFVLVNETNSSSGGGFNANQQVNTTSNVTFNLVNITRNLNVGNVSNTSNVMTIRGQKGSNSNKTLVIQNETGGEMAIFASNGKVCLSQSGAPCNPNALTLQVQRNDNADGLLVYVASDTAANGAQFQFRKSRGNINSSTNPQAAVLKGDTAFSINVLPYDGALFQTAAQIQAKIDDDNNTKKVPTGLFFNTAGQGSVVTTKLYLSSRFDNYFNGTLTVQNNLTQINTPTYTIIGTGDTDTAGVFNSLLINGTVFDACTGTTCPSGNPTWTSAFAIDYNGTYYSGTTAGLTRTITVQNTTLTTCTIAYTGGLYTGGTCR